LGLEASFLEAEEAGSQGSGDLPSLVEGVAKMQGSEEVATL